MVRFYRLDGAIVSLQKNAHAVRLFLQYQSATVPAQARKLLDTPCSLMSLNTASRVISASVRRTWPGQRQQAVQR
ncbi:MAG TPA: hypothetical protein VKA67_00440 [Verrucomicrobiae bacterium]|nr:hypothetical protein [Verrucomicrobiae bacterium]